MMKEICLLRLRSNSGVVKTFYKQPSYHDQKVNTVLTEKSKVYRLIENGKPTCAYDQKHGNHTPQRQKPWDKLCFKKHIV